MPLKGCLFSLGWELPCLESCDGQEGLGTGFIQDVQVRLHPQQTAVDVLWLSTKRLPVNHVQEQSRGSYKPGTRAAVTQPSSPFLLRCSAVSCPVGPSHHLLTQIGAWPWRVHLISNRGSQMFPSKQAAV